MTLRDRDIVELAVPPRIVADLVRSIYAHDGDDPETAQLCHEVGGLLTVAQHEPMRHAADRGARLQRRVHRAAEAVADVADGWHMGSVILATRLLIQRLISEGWIELHADSAFDQAWDRLSSAIEQHAEPGALDRPQRRGEADRLAREMRRALAARGLYAQQEVAA